MARKWLWPYFNNAIRARFGGPRAEMNFGKQSKMAGGHWEKARSSETKRATRDRLVAKQPPFWWLCSRLFRFSRRWRKKGNFWALVAWGQSENANFSAMQKLLLKMGPTQLENWNVMWDWERGLLVAPGGPRLLVGGHMSAHITLSLEAKRKKIKDVVGLSMTIGKG
jgi:hypothetical protein